MIKMFIGNEEVVSNHEFSIKEEMLSASSTILNNCYPKSWELTKDYVSNFYYPKDYSKYVLASGGFEYGDTEYSILDVNGNQPQFESNVEKEWNSLNIYGKTEQKQTTPNKNLLYINSVSSGSGVTITRYSNSEIVITGTSTSSRTITIPLNSQQLSNQPYTVSAIVTGTINKEIYIDLNTTYNLNLEIDGSGTFTQTSVTETASNIVTEMVLTFNNATTFNNVHIKLQLEQSSTATSYIESQLAMPSPDYPSKLNSVGYENIINFADREYKITNYYYRDFGTGILITEDMVGKVISFSYNVKVSDYSGSETTFVGVIGRSTNNSGMQNNIKTSGYLPMPNELTNIKIENITIPDYVGQYLIIRPVGFRSPSTANIEVSNVQITYGGTSLSYIPYGKYGIEVKTIGKNILLNTIKSATTYYGVTFTPVYNSDNMLEYITANGTATGNISASVNSRLYINKSTYYTLSGCPSGGTTSTYRFVCYLYDKNNTYLAGVSDLGNGATISNANVEYANLLMYITSGTTCNNLKFYPMLEKGTQATGYEPYKENIYSYQIDEPLRSIGDTKDLLYIKNGMLYVERKIGSVIYNGTENGWNVFRDDLNHYNYWIHREDISKTIVTCFSNYFKYQTAKNNNIGEFQIGGYNSNKNGNIVFNPFNDTTNNLAQFKTWLTTHNTEVQYILAEPYTEEVGQVQIPYSFEGINNVLLNIGVVETIIDVYYYWKNYNVIFAGIVKNSGEISLNPRHPHYCSLQILDYKTFLSESDTLDYVITNKTIREAIQMVVDTVSDYGFSVGTIDISSADDVIGAYSTLNKTAYDVLQYLADISGSRWRARYIDNSSMAIDFYEPDTLPQVEDIEYTQEYWENNNIVDLTFNYGTRDYRNKQIVLSDEVYAGIDYNEIILSNGYNTNFITSQNVGIVKEITVDGVKKDVISQQERELGADADFYYTPGKNIIESSSSYTAGTQIAVIYTPLVKGRQIVFNNDEVGRIATQTDTIGVISRYESRNDVVSSAELERIGETYIEYKGKAEVILTLTTHNKDLFNIGEVTYFNSPIDELKQKYMVKSKETQYIIESETGAINLFYVYELTSSFNSEKAINYFDNQRNKAQGNIQEGESITRNIDINSSAVIVWGNSSIEETTISVVGDNVLNSVLNSPFIE